MALVFALVTNLASAPAVLSPPRTNQELFDLADRIEKLPAEGGAYWRDVRIDGNHLSTGGYRVMVVGRRETRLPRDPADLVLTQVWRQVSARPVTAEDERAWQAGGSSRPGQGALRDQRAVRFDSGRRRAEGLQVHLEVGLRGNLSRHDDQRVHHG
ncbi:hypothetical protein AB0C28_30080 [Nonomuraea sp. NPDC048892]|uniref:hypothetical protein n=1 Tax=Nonomuraea sp. NPDC048892 TaxID=3154624 RepID=UPI0033C9E4C2